MSAERERILALFEKHRARPGTPYDESHFKDYLLANPKKKNAVPDSFRGLRRYWAFIEELQLEFAICFAKKDHERNYSVDQFVARVQELQASRRSSLASLKHQMTGHPNENMVIFTNLILLGPLIAALKYPWLLLGVLPVVGLVNLAFFLFHRRERTYQTRLLAKITGAEPTEGG